MLNILATGTLVSDPKSRQSATGKAYATASMRVPTEDSEAMLASLIAFNADAVASILALSKGDSLSVAGRAKPCFFSRLLSANALNGIGIMLIFSRRYRLQ